MKLTITITCDNAAFEHNQGIECARILHKLAESLETSYQYGLDGYAAPLFDANGNKVGMAEAED